MSNIVIKTVPATLTWPLRQQILRPHQTVAECEYPGDFDLRTIHLGAFTGEQLVGVGTTLLEAQDREGDS